MQRGEFGAGACADFLDPRAALAEHDRALRRRVDQDLLVDLDRSVARAPYTSRSRPRWHRAVRRGAGDRAARASLRRRASVRWRRRPGPRGNATAPRASRAASARLELGHAVAGRGARRRRSRRTAAASLSCSAWVEQLGLVGDIDLVEDQIFALAAALRALSRIARDLGADAALAIDHQRDQIGALARRPRRRRPSRGRAGARARRCRACRPAGSAPRPRSRRPSAACAWSAPWG